MASPALNSIYQKNFIGEKCKDNISSCLEDDVTYCESGASAPGRENLFFSFVFGRFVFVCLFVFFFLPYDFLPIGAFQFIHIAQG